MPTSEHAHEISSLKFPNKIQENGRSIARVAVEGLFGQYDYELPVKDIEGLDLSRLFIMYGENGSGKTTLLKLTYHALSPADGEGHRSFLGETRFNRFAIELHNGTVIEAKRKIRKSGGGLLQLAIHREARTLASVDIELDEDLSVSGKPAMKHSEHYKDYLKQLSDLKIRVYYVSDNREHQGQLTRKSSKREMLSWQTTHEILHASRVVLADEYLAGVGEPDREDKSLQKVMNGVVEWIRHQARKGSAEGQGNFYSLFSKVVQDISVSEDADKMARDIDRLVTSLGQIRTQSEQYARYGLIVKVPVDDLISAIQSAPVRTYPVLYNVIKSQMDGIQTKLNALSDLYHTIDRFIETINSFYRDKRVSFNVDQGFLIRSANEHLNPALLSSGERQMLLLLCNTFLARRHAGLFLIDEPELSLNVKWQRKLVQAILDNTEGSTVQFLLATHSMELISQHNDNVVTLKNRGRRSKQEEPPDGVEA